MRRDSFSISPSGQRARSAMHTAIAECIDSMEQAALLDEIVIANR